jgi:transcriptional regulator with PAS, ATPase and Fis domain
MTKSTFLNEDFLILERDKFVNCAICDTSKIRPIVMDSWVRSKKAGIHPIIMYNEVISKSELDNKLKEYKLLLSIILPYIENIYSFVKDSGFAVSLTNREGYVLKIIGDESIIKSSNEYSSFREGANRREDLFGTNAIGTCMEIDKPLQICGAEHYVKVLNIYTCSAAPIHDEFGKIIGCINLTGHKENVHSHSLGMVVAAVDGIEKQIKINNAYSKIHIMNNQLETILNSINTALIVVSNDGKIINANKSALKTFKLGVDCIDKHINNVLYYNTQNIDLENLNRNYLDTEIDIQSKKYSITTAIYNNKFDQSVGSVISFKEMKLIHKMVNKYSGFSATYTINDIIGQSSEISYVKNMCLKASKSTSNVLILGESGTGKELVAQSIHNESSRRNEPFIAINCGALPKGLIESELFGYEGGSFTGASKEGKPGKFELADGGTIFLDEIGDMPLDTQVSLLRVLQEKKIDRIGGNKPKPINIRVIAATNKNLYESIKNNSFREDLFYRLNVFTISVPPLRDRIDDIRTLSNHFINYYSIALNKNVINIDDSALKALQNYKWPGNIRELENVLERSINIVESESISFNDLPLYVQNSCFGEDNYCNQTSRGEIFNTALSSINYDSNIILSKKKFELEKEEIIRTLKNSSGNIEISAHLLGISRRTLYRKIKKYDILVSKLIDELDENTYTP